MPNLFQIWLLTFSLFLVPILPITLPQCTSFTNSECSQTDGCVWGYCNSTYSYNNNSACYKTNTMDDCLSLGCNWGYCISAVNSVTPALFPPSCSNITDNTTCSLLGNCTWNGSNCTGTWNNSVVQCSDLPTPEMCTLVNGCYYINGTCTAGGTFGSVKMCPELDVSVCLVAFDCSITCSGSPHTSCNGFHNQVSCTNFMGCSWNGTFCSGYIQDQQPCNRSTPVSGSCAIPGCSYVDTCTAQNCFMITNGDVCSGTPGCLWNLNYCIYLPLSGGRLHINAVQIVIMMLVVISITSWL